MKVASVAATAALLSTVYGLPFPQPSLAVESINGSPATVILSSSLIPQEHDSSLNFPGAKYLGCYSDAPNETLGYSYNMPNSSSILRDCRDAAVSSNATRFAVRNGHECRYDAGSTVSQFGMDATCTTACPDGSGSMCGDAWANSVYLIDPYACDLNLYALAESNCISVACSDEEVQCIASYTPDRVLKSNFHSRSRNFTCQRFGCSSNDQLDMEQLLFTQRALTGLPATVLPSSPLIPQEHDSSLSFTGAKYLGCYSDAPSETLGYSYNMPNSTNILRDCRDVAISSNATLFAVRNGYECRYDAGSVVSQFGKRRTCDVPCPDGSDSMCGDVWANSVYLIDRASMSQLIYACDLNLYALAESNCNLVGCSEEQVACIAGYTPVQVSKSTSYSKLRQGVCQRFGCTSGDLLDQGKL